MALTDSGNHPPAASGTYDYNATPNVWATLAVGASDTDPVFGESYRRLTNIGANVSENQNYSYHNINADGTLAFHTAPGGSFDITNVATGAVVHSGQPSGPTGENRWHMTDRDKYFYFNGADLVRRNLAAQNNTTMHTFPATLAGMGGTANYSDRESRYFLVNYSGTVKLWDSQTNTIYGNDFAMLNWVGIAPSGNTIVTQAGGGSEPNVIHSSFAVNHGAQTIAASPNQYWGIQGDHAALISPTDGNDYAILFDNNTSGSVYRTNLATNNAGKTVAQQLAAATLIIPTTFAVADGGFSAVSVGAKRDWCLFSSMDGTDDFNEAVGAWAALKKEIMAVNVLTGALRRLAHHRSRGQPLQYQCQPRASCSPTGDRVLWMSNQNDSTPASYADMYVMDNPLGAEEEPPPPPVGFALDDSGYSLTEPQTNPTMIGVW